MLSLLCRTSLPSLHQCSEYSQKPRVQQGIPGHRAEVVISTSYSLAIATAQFSENQQRSYAVFEQKHDMACTTFPTAPRPRRRPPCGRLEWRSCLERCAPSSPSSAYARVLEVSRLLLFPSAVLLCAGEQG